MKHNHLVLISLTLLVFSQLHASKSEEVNRFQLNMAKYSRVIMEGSVIGLSEEKDSYNDLLEVVTVQVKDKIAGEEVKSTLLLKYQRNRLIDALWRDPKFQVGDQFIAFLGKTDEHYYPIGGAYGIFKVFDNKIEKSSITQSQFKTQLIDVRNSDADQMEFPVQGDIEGAEGLIWKLGNEFSIMSSSCYGPLVGTNIEFQLNPAGALDKDGNQLSFSAVKSAIQRALDTWNNVTHSYATLTISDIQFTGSRNNADDISTITFEKLDCNGQARVNHSTNTGIIHVVDIVFSKGYEIDIGILRPLRWNTDVTYPSSYPTYLNPFQFAGPHIEYIGPVDLEDIAAHELGHAVGLEENIPQTLYTMRPTDYVLANWWEKTWRRSLEVGDKAGKIYQNPDFPGSATQSNSKILLSSRSTTSFGGTFTVPSNYLFVVEEGKTLAFSNGAALIINGTLTADGGSSSTPITFNFGASNASTQNGIKFNSGSSGTINYCKIRNAYRGIYENSANINITNSAFSNCFNGLYLYNSSPIIQYCNFHDNVYAGIYLIYSSPYLYNNYMRFNYYGVYSIYSSNPKFGNGSTQGENGITDNYCGVYCWNNSYPVLGKSTPLYGGYNNLVNAAYNVYNSSSGTVYANHIWWGATTPANFKIYGSGTTSYTDYLISSLTINPAPPLSKSSDHLVASADNNIPMLSVLEKAYQLIASNNLSEARDVCLNLIHNYPDYSVSFNALNLLRETYTTDEIKSEKDVYKTLFNSKAKKDIYAMAGLILSCIDEDNRLNQIDEVINCYEGESIIELALFDKFVHYYFGIDDKENALAISKELDEQFPLSQGAVEAHRILGDEEYYTIEPIIKKGGESPTVVTMMEFSLSDNYPNPFNPTTTIRYELPKAGNVTLKVYNLLGKEVATLVSEEKPAGAYEVEFNGSHLASGVYLYKIQAGSFSNTKKFILMK